jgi:hypothetical protein
MYQSNFIQQEITFNVVLATFFVILSILYPNCCCFFNYWCLTMQTLSAKIVLYL